MTAPFSTGTEEPVESYRPLLFSIAYRLLGSATEAEDVVQETYLRYAAAGRDGETKEAIRTPRAWLSTVAAHIALDQLRSARVRREQYVGPWLPEPVLTDGAVQGVEERESMSTAFLLLLERLSPEERAVFVLHEAFDYSHAEIGGLLKKSEAASRQLLRRAKTHVAEARPRARAALPRERQSVLLEGLVTAAQRGDVQHLASLLAADATLFSDGGGKVTAALRPIFGRDAVARFIVGVLAKSPPDATFEVVEVNGQLGLLARVQGLPSYVAAFDAASDDEVSALYLVANPDKLAYVRRQLQDRP
ncbi:MAG TPA: RNA polymerase sigma-70 factor [Chloroflexota bacterium]